MHRAASAIVAAAIAVGCGAGGDDPSVDATPGCTRPALDAPNLASFVSGVVAQLAVAPRFTTTQREAARTYLSNQLAAQGWQPQLDAYGNGANVFATIPATTTDAHKTVVVGAHFDTVSGSPGANDNATGVAVVLALGRYLEDTPCRNAPVILVLFDQEELGLFGSRAFALTLAPADVRAVHTIDQVAWDEDGDNRFELELPSAALEAEWRAAAAVVGVPVTVTTTSGTDHEAFRDRGFAAVGLTEEFVGGDSSPLRHTAGDTAMSVAPFNGYLVSAAKLTAQVVLEEVSP